MIPQNIIVTARTRPDAWLMQLGKLNPHHELHFFDDGLSRALVAEHFPGETLAAYDKVVPRAYKADLFRYCALQVIGGIYTDHLIPYCLPFAEMWDLKQDRVYLVRDKKPEAIQVAIMACNRGSRLMRMCQQRATLNILNEYYGDSPLSITGPRMAWRCLVEYTGRSRMEIGEIHDAVGAGDPPVQINFEINRTCREYRRDIADAVVVDQQNRMIFPYKLNRSRTHRSDKDYYWKAWHRRAVYGEPESVRQPDP